MSIGHPFTMFTMFCVCQCTQESLASCAEKVVEAEKHVEMRYLEAQRLSDRLRKKDLELEELRRSEEVCWLCCMKQ
jgi:hypothetical protein